MKSTTGWLVTCSLIRCWVSMVLILAFPPADPGDARQIGPGARPLQGPAASSSSRTAASWPYAVLEQQPAAGQRGARGAAPRSPGSRRGRRRRRASAGAARSAGRRGAGRLRRRRAGWTTIRSKRSPVERLEPVAVPELDVQAEARRRCASPRRALRRSLPRRPRARSGRWRLSASAMAPQPVPRSTRGGELALQSASSTSSSVSGRGISTPGSTASSRP